ncbi:MAG: chain length-determining protein [Candidatus Competibacter sp.]|nr:chain length-determining protein [Candidatus Competibacter sp.]MDG4605348.1 GNVR domain-containing protein [Candidatus Contendobacter sp.]HRD48140.1 GNVR domain-containing protein [Candidatus Contendobacter sp.]
MNEIIEQLLGYLRGIWRNRWYALGCAWLVCLIGWVVVHKLPDQYEASARVFVDTQSVLRPLLQGLAVNVNPDAQIGLVTRTLLSRPNLEKIVRLTDLDIQAKDPDAMDQQLNKLQKKIVLGASGRENLYSVTYQDRDAQLAKKVVQSVVTVFAENLLGDTRQDTDTAQRFLDKQIAEYEARLAEAENRVKEFKRKNIALMGAEGQGYFSRMQQATADLETARLELTQAENRRNSLLQQIGGEEPTFGIGPQPGAGPGGKAASLPIDARIQNLEKMLDELLIKYTEKHPDVIIIKQTIIDLKKQRDEELAQYAASTASAASGNNTSSFGPQGVDANPVYQQLKIALGQEEANIASLQARVVTFDRRVKELQDQVNTVPQIEAELAGLNRDYEVNRKKFEDLLTRRESAKMSQQIEQTSQDVRFKIIDPPRVPPQPSGPNRPLLMSVVLGAGLAIGLALAFLVSQLWPTFDTRRSLMQITNIPVFGSVSAVLSLAEVRRERLQVVAYASLGGMLLMAYAGLLVVETIGLQWPF